MATIKLITTSAFDYLNFDQFDVDDLFTLRETQGGYYERCFEFVASLKDKDKKELSVKQIKWASDIHDELDAWRRKRTR